MKHYLLSVANGLYTPLRNNSHGKSSHFFNFRFSLFTPLLVLFLLIVGNSPAWADCTFTANSTMYFDLRTAPWYNDGAYFIAKFYNASDTYLTEVSVSETTTSHVYSFKIPNRNDIDRIKIDRMAPDHGRWGWTVKLRAVDAGSNDCMYMPSWTDNPVSCSWTKFGSGSITTGCGGGDPGPTPSSDTFQGGEVFYMKQNTICKDGNIYDFLEYGRCDFNLYSVDGGTFLNKALSAQVIPNTDPVMLKFVVPAEYAGTVWGQVKVKQLETSGVGHNETNKGAIPKDGKNYLINGNTMEWGTYVEPTVPTTTYTVTLHPNNGGSNIVRTNVPEGSTTSAAELNLAAVTYGVGTATWYTDAECTTPFTTVTGDMDLYAKWGVSGNYYFVSCLQTANDDGGNNGNWSNGYGQQLSYSFIAPSGHMPFEIIKDRDWNQKINGGNYADMFDNSQSDVTISDAHGHMDFTLNEPKKVTVSYNGKVTIKTENYSFDNSKTWRIKTSWGNGGNAWNYNTIMTNNGTTNATAILRNVPAGQHSFVVTAKENDNDAMATVGTETFNALYVDTSNPSSGLTWNNTSARRDGSDNFNSTTPQTDNRWRNCSFTLSEASDICITFDGGKIRCDIVAPNIVTFKDGENTLSTQEVSSGNKATKPADPTKAGYTFVKWQLDGSEYDFSKAVNSNITLNAVWAYKSIESVSLNKSTLTLFENSAPQTLTASYLPADVIGVTYTWSVAPAGVVTIDNGVVSVVTPGTATITCTATDQEDNSRSATCAVTVYEGEGCVMEEQAIFSHTILGNSIMGGSASNTLPEQESLNAGMESTCRKIKMYYDNLTSEFTADDNGVVKAKSGLSDNSDVWYEIKGGTNSNAIDGNFYYLKNVKTGGYITRGEGQYGNNGDWYFYTTITTPTNEKTDLYQFIYTQKGDPAKDRICSVWEYSGMNSNETYGLHRRNQDWAENYNDLCPNPMIVFGRGENQGNTTLNVNFIVVEEGSVNPDYLSTPIVYNTRSYYRFAQDAAISMTLDKKLRADDKIVVYCYNPSNAARNGGLYINNNKVADISIPANSENIFEYVTIDADAGKNTIEVRSDDNHFCVASVEVLRSLPVAAQDPMLTWSAPANYYTRLAAGPFTFEASSAKSSGSITYISSDENVVTVVDGVVTPIATGSATITATIEQHLCFGESSIQYNVIVEPTLQEAIDATPVGETLTLTHDYDENAVINKAITLDALDAKGYTIGDLTVEYTGDLTLSSELTVRDFTIWAKAGNTSTPAASGQVRNASELNVNRNAYFLYTVDPSGHVQYGWYDFTVPFPINIVSGIKGIQDGVLKENFRNGVDYAVMEYFGEKQAQGQYPYKKFSGVMQPNKLYTIALDDDYNYNTLRMQKTADGALVASESVTLNMYAGDAINANWNGVGNGTLHHADAGISGDFIQVYQSGNRTFLTVNKANYSLVVGSAFMVQVQETGTMTLIQANGNKPLLAPSRYESAPATAIQIASEGKPFSDQLFITASETGGQAYTPGVDVAKAGELGSANVPQIWTNAYNSSLCVHEAQLINGKAQYNLSIYAPVAGSYTLTSKNIPADYSLYLTQNGMIVSELSDTYTLDLSKGITTEYGLLLTEIYNSPTGIENTQTDKIQTTKIIRNGVLYILHNGKVYNAQGAKVK